MTSSSLAAGRIPAMVLAAGRGERMRPLTDHCPKPLLPLRGRPLMGWTLQALARGGCSHIVLNTGWLGEQIPEQWGEVFHSDGGPAIPLEYSHEVQDFGYALETAGGIARALPLLGMAPESVFWLAAGDVFVPDFQFDPQAAVHFAAGNDLAHLWLVPNPAHNPGGDFHLDTTGRAHSRPPEGPEGQAPRYTYSTIALLRTELFHQPWSDITPGNPQGTAAALAPLLRRAMDAGRVGASLYEGAWTDVGTPERLAALNAAA